MPKFKLYGGREGVAEFRTMALEEAKLLEYGETVWFVSNDGSARRVRVSGKPQVWKRTPSRVRVPVKYGMYEHGEFTERDFGFNGRVLVRL